PRTRRRAPRPAPRRGRRTRRPARAGTPVPAPRFARRRARLGAGGRTVRPPGWPPPVPRGVRTVLAVLALLPQLRDVPSGPFRRPLHGRVRSVRRGHGTCPALTRYPAS